DYRPFLATQLVQHLVLWYGRYPTKKQTSPPSNNGSAALFVNGYANATRMEEANAWRNPIDLVQILEDAFVQLQTIVVQSGTLSEDDAGNGRNQLLPVLLGDDPQAIVDGMLDALKNGRTMQQLAATVSYAAALRIARFHTSNEFGDWDTALHTFTFANAIEQGLKRTPFVNLLRGVFDAAMTVYLDRFLNIPEARIPSVDGLDGNGRVAQVSDILDTFPQLLDKQQQVDQAAALIMQFIASDGNPDQLLAMLGKLLLREDRDFHTIQAVEAAFKQYHTLRGTEAGSHVLVAAARYLAAHSPTVRAQGQTYQIAARLHRGEHLFTDS
ncbi:Ferredoxin reductase, partial [hydrothermal vent metagenome]